jgi:hypothetical protein
MAGAEDVLGVLGGEGGEGGEGVESVGEGVCSSGLGSVRGPFWPHPTTDSVPTTRQITMT